MGIFDNSGFTASSAVIAQLLADYQFVPAAEGGAAVFLPQYRKLDVRRYGAKADSHGDVMGTDCINAFNEAVVVAANIGWPVWVPAAPIGYSYGISAGWTIANFSSFYIIGDGVLSMIVNHNAAGANSITLSACSHWCINGLGLDGVAGSGNGIEVTNSSHFGVLLNTWIGGVDGNAFQNTSGISTRVINLSTNINNGYNPAGMGAARGRAKIGVYVPSHPNGFTNNVTLVACDIENGFTIDLKVGDAGQATVESFAMFGGTIQGSVSKAEVYLHGLNCHFYGVHIEPSVGTNPNYVFTFDGCTAATINGGIVVGDIAMLASLRCGVTVMRGSGLFVDGDCQGCFYRDSETANTTTGPAGGSIIDQSQDLDISNTINASNVRLGYGYSPTSLSLPGPDSYFDDFDTLDAVPCGWNPVGAVTVTHANDGLSPPTYWVNIKNSGAILSQGITKSIGPIQSLKNRWVTVDVWLQNNNANLALVWGSWNGGAASTGIVSSVALVGSMQRIQARFFVKATDGGFNVLLSGQSGCDFNVYSIRIAVENWTEQGTEYSLAPVAIPSVNDYGYTQQAFVDPGSGTAVTRFSGGMPGRTFRIRLAAARTFTASTNLRLAGSANFVGKANDVIEFEARYSGSAFFYQEIARTLS